MSNEVNDQILEAANEKWQAAYVEQDELAMKAIEQNLRDQGFFGQAEQLVIARNNPPNEA